MNPPIHITQVPNGYDGHGTIRIGESYMTFKGHLDRKQIDHLRHGLHQIEQWINQKGAIGNTGAFDFGDVVKGASVVSDVAKSPLGGMIAGLGGPYGALAIAAATQAGPALQTMQGLLGGSPYTRTVAAMAHPDPAVQAKAKPVIDAIMRDVHKGLPEAHAAFRDLNATIVRHKDLEIKDLHNVVGKMRDQLALYGDPMSYANTGGYDEDEEVNTGAPDLAAVLDRALNRAYRDPQPSWRGARRR